jgi:hypothetical protein
VPVARCTVERLMRQHRWRGVTRARTVRTTVTEPTATRASDLVYRRFTAERPDVLWVADFTYVPMTDGRFGYTAFVIDAFAGLIPGWDTHAASKSNLVHALTAHYRQRGVLVTCTPEPARTSPFIEETVIHGKGTFDLTTELDLFGAQIATTLSAARHHQLLICDKTVMNVLAYARLVLAAPAGSAEAAVLDAMAGFCRAWALTTYDAVYVLSDAYPDPADPMRAKVTDLQHQTAAAVRRACAETAIPLHDVPAGLDLPQRVAHLARRVDAFLRPDRREPQRTRRWPHPPG